MNIMINENLKEFRKKKGNTQEELAAHIGISAQAVSKWERNEGYPDITVLPAIAAFYNVTVDDLLGVSKIKQEERIQEIIAAMSVNASNGDTKANIELMRSSIKEFPNDFRIITSLMHSLFMADQDKYSDEIIHLGNRILEESTDSQSRYSAIQLLCFSYISLKDYAKATEYANMLPVYSVTSNALLEAIYKGDQLLHHTQNNIQQHIDDIWLSVSRMLRSKEYAPDEKIHAWQTVIKFFETLYEDGDMGFYHCRISQIYKDIARIYAGENQADDAIDALQLAVKHAAIMDNMRDHKLTALLVDSTEYKASDTSKNFTDTYCQLVLKALDDKCFDFLREDGRFIEIEDKLRKCNKK
ncbi:MAG: helix-turn-helix domain-containing protein [Saccharofermentanales bacterium]